MKVWAVTFGDGYEFAGVVYEIYDNEKAADARAAELNAARQCQRPDAAGGYDVDEFTLNAKSEYL